VVPAVVHDVAAAGEASKVYPLVEAWTTSILHAGQFTAACGIDIYRGDALPAEYYGNSFTCEPTGSLVLREVITPDGPSFKGRSPYEGREFLASRDPWFRPVYCDGGPDGALYVCDMYRAVIEHPQFVPAELKNRPDLRYGDDRGRIYRIVGKDFKRPAAAKLSGASTDEIVKLFDHKSAWQRETAQRLLIERADPSAVPLLEGVVKARPKSRLGRIHALWTLQGLGALKLLTLHEAHHGDDIRLGEQVIVLSESFPIPAGSSEPIIPGIGSSLDSRIVFQSILSGPQAISPNPQRLAESLGYSGMIHAYDPWLRSACFLQLGEKPAVALQFASRNFFNPLLQSTPYAQRRDFVRELAALAAANNDRKALDYAWQEVEKHSGESGYRGFQFAVLGGLARGLKGNLSEVVGSEWTDAAVATVVNRGEDAVLRMDACDLLAHAPFSTASNTLRSLLQEDDANIRGRALSALTAHRDPQVGAILLDEYPKQSPKFRAQILDAMLGRADRVNLLLDAIESKRIKATDLDTTRTARLLKSTDAKIKARVEKLLAASIPADRTKALEDYRRVLSMTADARRGKEVFKKNCATCHKIGDVGTEVGPSIADLRTKTPEQVLTDVIQPNKAIDNNFVSYTVVTTDGLTHVGLIGADTPAGVTLKLPEGKTVSILKKDIELMESNGKSLMPEGVEKQIPHQDMADVIAFVKNWRYLDGAIPGVGGNSK
jgi:putative heme-binding domain-containing protein